jgi:lipid II:glycine glycyltransferase (peptidoglycan interpeptide bridge formation enzyme)
MEIKEINDKNIWEQFINRYSSQSLFQSWNWGETIIRKNEKLKMKNLWRLGIYDNEELTNIAQIEKVRAKRGAFLHLRHGPILKEWKKEYFSYFLEYLRLLGRRERVFFLRISPLINNSTENILFLKNFGFIDAPIHRMDGEVCWILDLTSNENTILAGMRKTTRYLIRQAEKLGVKIEKTTKIDDLAEFLELYQKTASRQGFVRHKGIREEFDIFSQDKQILLFKGYYRKELQAAALIVFYNHQAIYHHSASLPSKIPVNYLLQWEVIKEAKKRGKSLYNFWGIAPIINKRHPWWGLTLFKTGFGGEVKEYLHAKDLPLSPLYCTTYSIELVRRIWKGY